MNPAIVTLRKALYIGFEQVVRAMGGYENFKKVFKLADFTGALRSHIGYVGGYSKAEYSEAIAASFPESEPAEIREILLGFWKEHQKMFLELLMLNRMNGDNISRLVSIQGGEHLDSAMKAGKGAVLPVPHFGSIRILHYALALNGYPVSVVSSDYGSDPELVRRFKLGATSKVHQVGYRGDNPRWIIETLKDNRLLQIASTAEAGPVGVEVNFMNRRLFLTSGWVRLAMSVDAPILPAWIERGFSERHTIYIQPPFPIAEGSGKAERIQRTAQALLNKFEEVYRRNPRLIDWMSWMVRLTEAKEHFRNDEG